MTTTKELIADLGNLVDLHTHAYDVVNRAISHIESLSTAERTLVQLGYTNNGGEYWKPPLGKAPDFDRIDALSAEVERLSIARNKEAQETVAWMNECDQLRAQLEAQGEAVNAWQIYGMDGEPLFIQQDEGSAKWYAEAGHKVVRLALCKATHPAPAAPVVDAFDAGFRCAAGWAQRDDLFADINSPTYKKDRAQYLAAQAQAQPAQGLTDDEIRAAYESVYSRAVMGHGSFSFARAIEAAIKKGQQS